MLVRTCSFLTTSIGLAEPERVVRMGYLKGKGENQRIPTQAKAPHHASLHSTGVEWFCSDLLSHYWDAHGKWGIVKVTSTYFSDSPFL